MRKRDVINLRPRLALEAVEIFQEKRLRKLAGAVRALGAGMAKRMRSMPELATLQEQGLPGFECYTWNAFFAPAGTPPQAVNRMAAAVQQALKDPATKKRMEEMGTEPVGDAPGEFRAFLQAEVKKWGDFVRQSGIKVEQ